MTDHTLTKRQHDLACTALYEINQIVTLLRDQLMTLNANASVPMLFGPAMLERIALLSDAAAECVWPEDWDESVLEKIIEQGGGRPSPEVRRSSTNGAAA